MLKVIVAIVLIAVAFLWWRRASARANRARFIDQYAFPERIAEKLQQRYPHLSDADLHQVNRGLREYFHICRLAGAYRVSMPSQVVDVAWHEFILYTRSYRDFCRRAFGRFLHHTPAEAMRSPHDAQDGIKRAWRLACGRERIDSKAPNRLPLLFALDAQLKIPDGFVYALACTPGRNEYCATHIGCGGGCSSGSSSAANTARDGTCSNGHSCSGNGCSGGGGCGGGGD